MNRAHRYALCAAGALLLLGLAWGARDWRREAIMQRPLLPVAFEHSDHDGTACADCHHNFIDDTGGGACYNCHKLSPELSAETERMFHEFCRDCHVRTRQLDKDSGPLRECSLCHH